MSQALINSTTCSIRNRENWCLSTDENSVELSNPWGLPYEGATQFVYEDGEEPTGPFVHKTIQTLSQKNCRAGFQVYKGDDGVMYVVFGKPGLAGGARPKDEVADYAIRRDVTEHVTGLVLILGLVCTMALGNDTKTLSGRAVNPLFLATLMGTLLQGSLYYAKTPKKEFSNHEWFYAALQGAGTGFTMQTFSLMLDRVAFGLSPRNARIAKYIRDASMAALTNLAQSAYRGEAPSFGNMMGAIMTRAAATASTLGLDRLLPKAETMWRFIMNEAVKGATSGATSTLVSNQIFRGEHGERKKWDDDLRLAAVSGAVLGGVGAAMQGKLPDEIKASQEELRTAEEKMRDLQKDHDDKVAARDAAAIPYKEECDKLDVLEADIKPKKDAALKAHNDFVSTGLGKKKWEELQKEAGDAEKLFDKASRDWRYNPVNDTYWKAYWAASKAASLLFEQKELVNASRTDVFHQERMLNQARDMIAALPKSLEAVDPLETQIARIEMAENKILDPDAHRSMRDLDRFPLLQKRKEGLIKRLIALEEGQKKGV